MSRQVNRRQFIKSTSLTGAGFWVAGSRARARGRLANSAIGFACIGIAGKGSSDSNDAAKHGDIVAICDIDTNRLDGAAQRFPNARKFTDFREMLTTMDKYIDAVTVSTPDHTHAVASAMAMKMGKHCFCQKPLTHSLGEARRLGEIARQMKVVTQMGNQGTAGDGLRRSAAMLRAGVIGPVKEVHVWTDRAIWPQGVARPEPQPVPKHVRWDLFLGPAPPRPFAPFVSDRRDKAGYHPFAWRGWWDFGTGALGDMACHIMNMPFMGLDLRDPITVEAESSDHNRDSYPLWSVIRYEFGPYGDRPPLSMIWYDGGKHLPEKKKPPLALFQGERRGDNGALLIGRQGTLYCPDATGQRYVLLPNGGIVEPEVQFTPAPPEGHFSEFARAIESGSEAVSNFPDFAGPLTETVLLGNLAVWSGKKIEWDAKTLKAKNNSEVDAIIRPEYRQGWTL